MSRETSINGSAPAHGFTNPAPPPGNVAASDVLMGCGPDFVADKSIGPGYFGVLTNLDVSHVDGLGLLNTLDPLKDTQQTTSGPGESEAIPTPTTTFLKLDFSETLPQAHACFVSYVCCSIFCC